MYSYIYIFRGEAVVRKIISKIVLIVGVMALTSGSVLATQLPVQAQDRPSKPVIPVEIDMMKVIKDNKVLTELEVLKLNGMNYIPLELFFNISGVPVEVKGDTILLDDNNTLVNSNNTYNTVDMQSRDNKVKEVFFDKKGDKYMCYVDLYVNNNTVCVDMDSILRLIALDGKEIKIDNDFYINPPKVMNGYSFNEDIQPGGIKGSITLHSEGNFEYKKHYTNFEDRNTTVYYTAEITHPKNNKNMKYISEKVNQLQGEGIDMFDGKGLGYHCELKTLDDVIKHFDLGIKYVYDNKTNTVTISKK